VKYLGQAIDIKLGKPRNEVWQWVAKPLYLYRNSNSINCGTILCYNVKTKVLGILVENIPFREL